MKRDGELGSRRALKVLCAGLMLGAIPIFAQVSIASSAVLAGCILARFFGIRPVGRTASIVSRLAIVAVGGAGIYASYGTLVGLEPGISVLMLLIALKLLESRRARDLHVLALLGFFLCLTLLFFSQTLAMTLYDGVVFAVLVVALVQAQAGDALPLGRSALQAAKVLLPALPIMALLFVLLPRELLGMRFQLQGGLFARSGMSDRLEPGGVATLATSSAVAFRAWFADGEVPPASQLYWRGAVLWRCQGLSWQMGLGARAVASRPALGGEVIRQRVLLQPHGRNWLYALDRPAADFPGAEMRAGDFLRSVRTIYTPLRYEVVSRPVNRERELSPPLKMRALAFPETVSPAVRNLAEGWRARAGNDDTGVVDQALQYFRRQGFIYTLSPGSYGRDGLEEFLFQRRAGFCEHYAAAFATLMRAAGIPARVVVGYQGGEQNRGYVIVRQSDAHAWAEVWLEGQGWERVDPTTVVAPARISSGLSSFLESRAAGAGSDADALGPSTGTLGLRAIWKDATLAWDSLQYQWDLRVLNYDEESQHTLLMMGGLEGAGAVELVLWMALVIVGASGVIALWLGRASAPPADPLRGAYEALCRKAAVAGVAKDAAEGPATFGTRLAAAFPARAVEIRRFFERYLALRYGRGGEAGGTRELRRIAQSLRLRG